MIESATTSGMINGGYMIKKRFISGAICPKCQKTDTLRWWKDQGIESVECVVCSHHDQQLPKSVDADKVGKVIGLFPS